MAENKKSFILYSDQQELVETLTDEQAGKLLKHLYKYVNDENPVCTDQFTNLAFVAIKQALKRDLKKWESKQEQRVEAGKRSAEVRKQNANEAKQKSTTVNDRSVSSTVNDNVNGSGNVNEKDINKDTHSNESEAKTLSHDETFKAFWDHFHKITEKPKKEKSSAFKYWKKLNLTDQRKAYTMVKPLSLSNIDKDYLPYARTYLSGRSFDNEFIIDKPKAQGKETYEQIVSRTVINKRQTF